MKVIRERHEMYRLKNLMLILVITVCFKAKAQNTLPPSRPNILWIVSEDNSPLLGAYGDNFATTPYLDQMAS